MRSLLRLALSMHAPTAGNRDRLTAAMNAFGRVVSFDVWVVARIESPTEGAFRFAENFLSGASDAAVDVTVEIAHATAAKWTSLLASNPPSIQPLLGKHRFARQPNHSLIRTWTDAHEQSLISIRSSSAVTLPEQASIERETSQFTWFSVHRIKPIEHSFSSGDRRLLAILHDQASWALID